MVLTMASLVVVAFMMAFTVSMFFWLLVQGMLDFFLFFIAIRAARLLLSSWVSGSFHINILSEMTALRLIKFGVNVFLRFVVFSTTIRH